MLSDSQEYVFKKYLQERWNDLMRCGPPAGALPAQSLPASAGIY